MRRPRPLSFALAVLAALPLVGCYRREEVAKVEKDGSGSFKATATSDTQALNNLLSFGRMMMPSQPGQEPALPAEVDSPLVDAEAIVSGLQKAEGIQLESSDATKDATKKTVTVTGKFVDLEAYAKAGLAGFDGVSLRKDEDGSWTLEFQVAHQLSSMLGAMPSASEAPATGVGPAAGPSGMNLSDIIPAILPMVGGFGLDRTLTLPGKIVETTGTKGEDGSTVTFKVTLQDVQTSLGTRKPIVQSVTFAGEGLALRPFTYVPPRLDLQKEIDRLMNPKPKPATAPTPTPTTPPSPPAGDPPAPTPVPVVPK